MHFLGHVLTVVQAQRKKFVSSLQGLGTHRDNMTSGQDSFRLCFQRPLPRRPEREGPCTKVRENSVEVSKQKNKTTGIISVIPLAAESETDGRGRVRGDGEP